MSSLITNVIECPSLLSGSFYHSNQALTLAEPFPTAAQKEALLNRLARFPQLTARLDPSAKYNRRLGRFFENIVHASLYALYPDAAIYANIQIRKPYAPGELDFVIVQPKHLIHLEVALKFYLFDPTPLVSLSNFVGPRRNDRLDLKLKKIFGEQLQRHIPAEIREASRPRSRVERRLWLPGMLFYPWLQYFNEDVPLLAELNPGHARGWWMTKKAALAHVSRFYVLPKPFWLEDFPNEASLTAAGCRTFCEDTAVEDPAFCLRTDTQGIPLDRGFIVPENWSCKVSR